MIVEAPDGRTVISLRSFGHLEFIDGGDTVMIHFESAEHEPVLVVLPMTALRPVISALADDMIAQRRA